MYKTTKDLFSLQLLYFSITVYLPGILLWVWLPVLWCRNLWDEGQEGVRGAVFFIIENRISEVLKPATLYPVVFQTTYQNKCNPVYTKKCNAVPRKECKTTYWNKCEKNQVCKTSYSKKCTKVPNKTCKTVQDKKCHQIPKKECQTKYTKKCKSTPKKNCKTVYQQKCTKQPVQNCKNEQVNNYVWKLEHKACDILAAEWLRLMRFDNRLIIDSFQEAICILKW